MIEVRSLRVCISTALQTLETQGHCQTHFIFKLFKIISLRGFPPLGESMSHSYVLVLYFIDFFFERGCFHSSDHRALSLQIHSFIRLHTSREIELRLSLQSLHFLTFSKFLL